ncbi:hypothetical protein YC2023_124447 [Brassica napus]
MKAHENRKVSQLRRTIAKTELLRLHNVESTITELSGILTHQAKMVTQRGELAIRFFTHNLTIFLRFREHSVNTQHLWGLWNRIGDNMDESLVNVEGARSALLQHLTGTSSSRWRSS